MLLHHAGAGQAMGGGLDDFELTDDRVANAGNFGQMLRRSGQNAVEISKFFKKLPGQRLDVATGNGAEQDQFQHLVIRQGLRATGQEAIPQAFAVIPE